MTVDEAEALFDKYFEGKPLFKEMIENAQNKAIVDKYTEVPESGFRRILLDVDSKDNAKRSGALRQALNTQIQGFSAYIMQKALIKINRHLVDNNIDADIIVSVHDSMVVSTTKENVDYVGKYCKHVMESLDMDILNITIDGEPTYFVMEADFNVGVNYNDECPYNEEEFASAVSSNGYCMYYWGEGHIKNLANEKLIDKELKETMLETHELWKPYYMSVNNISDNQDLAHYHKALEDYRG